MTYIIPLLTAFVGLWLISHGGSGDMTVGFVALIIAINTVALAFKIDKRND